MAEGLYVSTTNIQPIWAIEEYAKIFRSCVWFRPPQPPKRVDSNAEIIIKG